MDIARAFNFMDKAIKEHGLNKTEQVVLLLFIREENRRFWREGSISKYFIGKALAMDARTVAKVTDKFVSLGILGRNDSGFFVKYEVKENADRCKTARTAKGTRQSKPATRRGSIEKFESNLGELFNS